MHSNPFFRNFFVFVNINSSFFPANVLNHVQAFWRPCFLNWSILGSAKIRVKMTGTTTTTSAYFPFSPSTILCFKDTMAHSDLVWLPIFASLSYGGGLVDYLTRQLFLDRAMKFPSPSSNGSPTLWFWCYRLLDESPFAVRFTFWVWSACMQSILRFDWSLLLRLIIINLSSFFHHHPHILNSYDIFKTRAASEARPFWSSWFSQCCLLDHSMTAVFVLH